MTILWILNEGKKLSIGDETKLESLTENLMQNTEGRWDDGTKLSDAEVTLMTPPYAHGVLIFGWGSSMLMRFCHVHEVLLYEREEIEKAYCVKKIETRRLRMMQNGVHPERRKKTELAMKQRDSQS
jgi:hypothetical protein